MRPRGGAVIMPETTMKHFTDQSGRWIGHLNERSDMKIYLTAQGQVAARVINDKTYDGKGTFRGNGDQGFRLIGEKKKG